MDESKKEVNKTKRSKSDHVKNIVHTYLQKRNYASIGLSENAKIDQQTTYLLLEKEISRPNSILYSCYNSDPIVIDNNFTKFLAWVKDLVKNKNTGHDIEYLIAPLFCHLYLDILKGGHAERATTFFKAHLPAIDKTKCDDFVRDLINLFAIESDATCMTEQYRSSKYSLELTQQSFISLRKFVVENCHVVFLHILQTWFDLQQKEEREDETEEMMEVNKPATNGIHSDNKFQKILDVIQELENEPKQVFVLNIACTKDPVNCAMIKRSCGLVAYNQNSIIHLRPVHSYDSIIGRGDCKEIRLTNHEKQIFCIAISTDCSTLISGSADCTINIYNLIEMELINNCSGHLGPIYCVSISSNNAYMASGSQDTTARLWNMENGATLRIFVGHTQAITCLDFHPNCLYLATGSADRNVRLWSIDNGNPLRLFHGSKGIIYGIAFSPLGDCVASVGDDRKVRVWDVLTAKINHEFKHKGDPITKATWSKDGKQLCTGALDGVVRIWDLCNVQDSATDKNHEPVVNFSVNGKILNLEYAFETFACVTT